MKTKKPKQIRVQMELKKAKASLAFNIEKTSYSKAMQIELTRRQALISREREDCYELDRQRKFVMQELRTLLGHLRFKRIMNITEACEASIIDWVIYL